MNFSPYRNRILRMWEEQHGQLHPPQREKFLRRPELATIERYHEARVRIAFRRHRLFADVVSELEQPPDLDELAGELG